MADLPPFSRLKNAVLHYIKSFPVPNNEVRDHFLVKKAHTLRVVQNSKIIASRSGFSNKETELAMIIALFHDIGRFEQFIKYRTFNDDKAENHAQIAARVLQQQALLAWCDAETEAVILRSIENHNVFKLPEISDPSVSRFSSLLRDADKLDIWKITSEQNIGFTIHDEDDPDHYSIPDTILKCIREGQIVLLQYAKSMNDFRLLRLSWLVDINFPASLSILEEWGYIQKILARMPYFPEKEEISGIFHSYCQNRI